jgi:hypothetical protein
MRKNPHRRVRRDRGERHFILSVSSQLKVGRAVPDGGHRPPYKTSLGISHRSIRSLALTRPIGLNDKGQDSSRTMGTRRHPGEGPGPVQFKRTWIPAFTGMTRKTPVSVSISMLHFQTDTVSWHPFKPFFLSASSAHSAVNSSVLLSSAPSHLSP